MFRMSDAKIAASVVSGGPRSRQVSVRIRTTKRRALPVRSISFKNDTVLITTKGSRIFALSLNDVKKILAFAEGATKRVFLEG